MPKRTLLVYPNPFHAIDHEGRPAGVLPLEPEGDGVTTFDDRRFVGATLKAEILQKFPRGDARQSVQRTTFDFSDEPVEVRNTPYYRMAIARGEILAADKASALECGIDSTYLEPAKVLLTARDEAIGLWKRMDHEDHDGVPESLSKFAFGPMPEAVEARKKAADEADKAAKEAAAKAKAEEEAAKKAEEAKKAQAATKRGGE